MALPAVTKTWQYAANLLAQGTSVEAFTDAMWLVIKNALLAFPLNPWVVWGSCDGAGGAGSFGNNDGVDRWVDAGDLVHNAPGSNHSWIVLRNPVTGVSVCFDLNSANPNFTYVGIFVSEAGFNTNGTATACPTAADSVTPHNTGLISTAGDTVVSHVLQSTDGNETRILITKFDYPTAFIAFGVASDIPAGVVWGGNWYTAIGASTSAYRTTYGVFNDAAEVSGRIGGAAVTFYLTSMAYGSAMYGENLPCADDDTGEFTLTEAGLYCPTAGHRGKKGRVADVWWGVNEGKLGFFFPLGTTRTHMQMGDLVLPWNGSLMRVS